MPNLVYNLGVTGQKDVENALSGMTRKFVEHSREVNRLTGTSKTGSSAKSSQNEALREAARVAKQIEKDKQAAQKATAREALKMEKDRSREATSNIKKEEREKLQALRSIEREERRATANAARDIERSIAKQEAARKRFSSNFASGATKAAGGALSNLARLGGTALAAVGGFGAFEAIKGSVSDQTKSHELVNAFSGRGGKKYTTQQLEDLTHDVGSLNGFQGGDVLDAQKAFLSVRGTTLETAMNSSAMWGTTARAAGNGTTPADIAKIQAQMHTMGITDPNEVKSNMASMIQLHKDTGMSVSDIAENGMTTAQKLKGFGMGGAEAWKSSNALIAMSHASNGEDATGAVDNLIKTLTSNASELKSGKLLGKKVEVFGKDNEVRNPVAIMADVISAAHGDPEKIQKALGAKGGSAIATDAMSIYNKTAQGTKGTAGEKDTAARKAMEDFINTMLKSSGDYAVIEKDAADMRQTTAVKLAKFEEDLGDAIGDALLPILPKLTENITTLVPAMAKLAESVAGWATWAADNPWSTVMLIIAGSLTKSLGEAAIGNIVKGGLEKLAESAAFSSSNLMKFGGALGVTAAAYALTDYANENLKESTGGMGITDIVEKSLMEGKSPFAVVNEHQNAQAYVDEFNKNGGGKPNETIDQAMAGYLDANTKATTELTSAMKAYGFTAPAPNRSPVAPK